MNNNQWFDEHIREQLGNYAPEVHPRIWENIAAQKERRRPAGFWFSLLNNRNLLFTLALLLAGGAGAWLVFNNTSPAGKNEPEQAVVEKGSPSTENNSIANREKQVSPQGNNPVVDKNTATIPANTANSANTSVQNSVPVIEPSPGSKNLVSRSNTRIRTNSATAQYDENGYAGQGSKKQKSKAGSITDLNNENTEEVLNTDNLPAQGSLFSRLVFGAQKISADRKAKGELQRIKMPFGFLPDCPALEKNAAGNKKYIEIYGGADYAMRSMSDTGNSAYLQKRKESAKVSSAYSAGLRFTRVFNNSMSVRAGINYSQINEKFTLVQGNLVQVTYIIDANGDTTGSYITRGTRYKTTHNKYRSIDLPLTIGYEIGNGKLHANINVGPVINLYSWQKGDVLDTSYQAVSITTGKGSSPYQFKTNAGVGFIGAVSVYYKLNDKIHVMAEPYFRYNFTQLNKEKLTLKQKYNTVGLKLGLRVDLK